LLFVLWLRVKLKLHRINNGKRLKDNLLKNKLLKKSLKSELLKSELLKS
jgi:hypothetical protein